MNYSPDELQNIVFKKKFMGYSEDAVNDVLDMVIEDYVNYIRENLEYKDKNASLNEALQHYKSIEDSLQNSLILAQKTGEEVKKNAYEKADNIIMEAQMQASKIITSANEEVLKLKREYEEAKNKLVLYRTKSENLINNQLEMIRQISDEA